jgi:hypothetical protein
LLAVKDAVFGMRRMCWISYTVTHQPALIVTFLLQQDDFLRAAWHALRENTVIPFHVPVQGLQQETNMPVYIFLDWSYVTLITPLNICALARHEGKKVHATDVGVCDDLINRTLVTAAVILLGHLFFS